MYFLLNELEAALRDSQEIYIYGFGDYGKIAYAKLCSLGYRAKIRAFIVSYIKKKAYPQRYDGKQIIGIDEYRFHTDQDVILVAVSEKYIKEIQEVLDAYHYQNYILLKNYIREEEDLKLMLNHATFEECCLYFAECYISDTASKDFRILWDPSNLECLKNTFLKMAGQRGAANKNEISYIMGIIRGRDTKIIRALVNKGFQVEILQYPSSRLYVGEAELLEMGIRIIKCDSVAQALYKELEKNPYIYYIAQPTYDYFIESFMINNREKFGKIVVDLCDVLKISVGRPRADVDLDQEKYILESADGVVWRYDCKEYLSKQYGYKYQGKSIQFWDYCMDYETHDLPRDDKKLKLCYLPTHITTFMSHPEKESILSREATIWDFLPILKDHSNVELYVYAWEADENMKSQLQNIELEYPNFKFFIHVSHSQLIQEINEYDYGCVLLWEADPPSYIRYRQGVYPTEEMITYAVANKIFDFLSAGLPVIANCTVLQCDFLKSYGVLVNTSINRLDIDYLFANKQKYRENVSQAKEALLVDNHVEKLIDFFHEVYNAT